MERLTKYCGEGISITTCHNCDFEEPLCEDCCHIQKALEKLAAYEDTGLTPERAAELAEAENDGRLVVLPGYQQTVYFLLKDYDYVIDGKVMKIEIIHSKGDYNPNTICKNCLSENEFVVYYSTKDKPHWPKGRRFQKSQIGKSVFLTRDEAEAALAQR
jgi:hypothetical protein